LRQERLHQDKTLDHLNRPADSSRHHCIQQIFSPIVLYNLSLVVKTSSNSKYDIPLLINKFG
jgi:hypothetical protein